MSIFHEHSFSYLNCEGVSLLTIDFFLKRVLQVIFIFEVDPKKLRTEAEDLRLNL